MRFILFAPIILAACAGAAPSGTAVYLYPGSKAEIVSGGKCTLQENLSDDVLAPASVDVTTWSAQGTRTDQAGNDLVRVTACGA